MELDGTWLVVLKKKKNILKTQQRRLLPENTTQFLNQTDHVVSVFMWTTAVLSLSLGKRTSTLG